MNEINLLPQDLKPDKSISKFAHTLKNISLIGTTVLLLSLVVAFATYLLFQQRTSTSESNQRKLETQIKALKETEQRLVLIKDRLNKINSLKQKGSANDEVDTLKNVSALFPGGVQIDGVELVPDNAIIKVASDNLSDISAYLATVISDTRFKRINLVSLDFNPEKGYSVALAFPQ